MADHLPRRFFEAGERSSNQSSQKQRLLDKYLIGQGQFDEQFVSLIFSVGQHDPQVGGIIQQQSLTVLVSKQKAAIHFLQQLIAHPQYHHIPHGFLLNLIELKTNIYNQPLLHYVLRSLPKLLEFLNRSNSEFIHAVITFLAHKMRSFDLQTRIIALQTLKELGLQAETLKGEWEKTLRKVVPLMIEKQQLVKEVSYIKGLFLQMLEDEFHQVRVLTIQCLGIFQNYMRIEDLKQIIVYMLNDEHELVREQALQAAKILKSLPLAKDDLQTFLMCLKEKSTNLRRLVYENLSSMSINDVTLLLLLLEKILVALQNYRSDKKPIYKALYELGCQYHLEIGKIFPKLGLSESEEPNFKNIVYKAKMVLCHDWWKKKRFLTDFELLPSYFTKHMLYISDVQSYLFDAQKEIMEQEFQSSIDYSNLGRNFHHLVRFIECEEDISQEFHKILLEVTRQWLINQTEAQSLINKLGNASITFNLSPPQLNLKKNLEDLVQSPPKSTEKVVEIVRLIINNRENFELINTTVAFNKCTVSRLEPNLVLSSKCRQFIDKVFLKCWKNIMINKDRKFEYKKLKDLQFLSENSETYFWRANLSNYSQIQCVLMIAGGKEKVLDSFDLDQK